MRGKLNLILVLCILAVLAVVEGSRMKCGSLQEKCVLLSTGKLFWPSDWTTPCSLTPMCPSGYTLKKQMLGNLRACCCMLKNVQECPDCDMTGAGELSFFEWFDVHMQRNGPPDGTCPSGKFKRIFFGGPQQLDKCCCEPRNSPYLREPASTEEEE